MMKFREVERNIERENLNNEKEEGYKQIKASTNITNEEVKNFWNTVFALKES